MIGCVRRHTELAESPAALKGYNVAFAAFDKSSFTPAERQVVYLAVNYENRCHYCMAGHSVLAGRAGVSDGAVEAVREGREIPDACLEALRRFASRMTATRGQVDPAEVDGFLAAGFTRAQVYEVILAIATKTLSNYTNHVANTPPDPFMAGTAWVHPDERGEAGAPVRRAA